MSSSSPKAFEVASPNLPHFAGLNWRLDVPRASRASASNPQGDNKVAPVYSVRLSLAQMEPGALDLKQAKKKTTNTSAEDSSSKSSKSEKKVEEEQETAASGQVVEDTARIKDVAFSCTPETLLALADAVEDAVKQSEQAPYRRILRMIK